MPDAIVIGSGPNGLAAAIRLAEAGRQVLVLEAADTPGGGLRTQQLTLPDFHHDTFSSVHPAGAASPVFERMPLDDHGLQWIHPEACAAHPLADGRAAVQYRDLEQTIDSLNALSAGDGDNWASFVSPYLDAFDAVRQTMLSGFPPLRGPLKMLRDAGPARLAAFTRQLPETAVSLGNRLFDGSENRAWLYGAAMHGDTPPQARGSAIAAFYLYLLGHAVGWPSPKGGSGKLGSALASYFRSLGGEIRCDARVDEITSAHGRATGARITGGEHFAAPVVVATIMPSALLELTGDALHGWYRAGLKRYVYGPGTLKLDWALDGPIPWTNTAVRGAGTVHVGGTESEFLDSVSTAARELPALPFMLLGQQSIADPGRAPAGKHTAWAYTHAPTRLLRAAGPQAAHVDAMEARIEEMAPGFRQRILARHVMGPDELQARDANLVGGDVGGGSYRLRQVVFRPLPKLDPYRTPLTGLFLGSAATFPGGAVHGVPGDSAANSVLRGEHRLPRRP